MTREESPGQRYPVQDTATTKGEVYARKNLAEWDKDYARQVLERIVKAH